MPAIGVSVARASTMRRPFSRRRLDSVGCVRRQGSEECADVGKNALQMNEREPIGDRLGVVRI